ncbi:hypothetical protein LGR54_10685 [Ancylobacter sp. Lp-2]|uniref:hypothetical protein n=1 Tax=Ancylobacter sp. Lp-2 TaxID=2881339 RepID=UPI001E58BF4F|nr:hypothetical protein [Ancylobacter sp. Lp-2]MCB4769069.1 hypothetical protein [Ancylobacter sp. Lp-2]
MPGSQMKCIACIEGEQLAVRIYKGVTEPDAAFYVVLSLVDGTSQTERLDTADERGRRRLQSLELSIPDRKRVKGPSSAKADYTVSLPDLPIKRIDVFVLDADGKRIFLKWAGDELALSELLPLTRDEFRSYFSYGSKRHLDSATVLFVARNILDFYEGRDDADEALSGYIANAFVILIYKSVETHAVIPDLDKLRLLAERHVEQLKAASNPREDRTNLRMSCRMVLWHYYLDRGEADQAVEAAESVAAIYESIDKLHVMHGYNACKSMLLCGLAYYHRKNIKMALKYFEMTVNGFVKSVNCRTKNPSWFAELGVNHRCATSATKMIKLIEDKTEVGQAQLAKELAVASRVTDEAFLARASAALFG